MKEEKYDGDDDEDNGDKYHYNQYIFFRHIISSVNSDSNSNRSRAL